MTYYKDLSIYAYFQTEGDHVLNIGWLSVNHEYPEGQTSVKFRNKLKELCSSHVVHLAMGSHECEFCMNGLIDYDEIKDMEIRKNEIIQRLNALKKSRKEGKLKSKDEIKQLQNELVEIARENSGTIPVLEAGATGNGEIRVKGKDVTYAAPTLIYHYVVQHNYLPPEEFIQAVEG